MVTFTEGQRAEIRRLCEAGNETAAQRLILAEIDRQA